MKLRMTFAFCLFSILLFSCIKEVPVYLSGEALIPLSDSARASSIGQNTKGDTLFYRFTEAQKESLSNASLSSKGVSLVLSLKKDESEKKETLTFYTGFLYEEDFLDDRKLMENMDARFQVSGVLSKEQLPAVDVALNFEVGSVPTGFFVKGEPGLKLLSVSFSDAVVGYDRRGAVPLYAFGPDGGGIDLRSSGFDFSSARKMFPAKNTSDSLLPKIVIEKASTPDIGTSSEQLCIRGAYSGEEFVIRCSPVSDTFTFQTSAFESSYGRLSFSSHGELVLCALLSANESLPVSASGGKVIYPLVSDIGLLFEYPQKNWRTEDYELFRWEEFPDVLIFDTANYDVQNQFFTRLAYFVEKTGYKGTFVSDSFILTAHGYNAHDYKADDLARFFTRAAQEGVRLNSHEILLREILIANNVIVQSGPDSYSAGKGSVISFSKESPSYLRYQLLAHEGWHGIYFGDEEFRDTVAMCYLMFDSVSMDFLQTYWETYESLQYDRSDEYLMRNEFMAYHLQQTVGQIADYFTTRAKWGSVQRSQKKNADYIVSTNAEAFTDTALFLSEYAFTRWGLVAGRVWNISR